MLWEGARGAPVIELQSRLAQLGFYAGPLDGVFGPKTTSALVAFQKRHGLTADGITGPRTISHLGLRETEAPPRIRNKVFVSYSHRDSKWLERLEVFLKPLERGGLVLLWDDTRIAPGQPWRVAIRTALATSRIAVLLISADFLASEYIASAELPQLLEAQELLLLPVILSPVPAIALGALAEIQAVNPVSEPLLDMKPGDQERVWVRLVEAITAALGEIPPGEEARQRAFELRGEPIGEDTRRRAKAIFSIFETGRPRSYVMVYVSSVERDLTFGINFASLRRGTLHKLLEAYCGEPGAKFADSLAPYLGRLDEKDESLEEDIEFQKRLKTAAGEDPAMIRVQDRMFDALYWDRAVAKATEIGIRTPLGVTAVFDTIVHMGTGLHAKIKALTSEQLDGTPITGIDEKEWIRVYLEKRRKELARSPAAVHSVYRVNELLKLVNQGNWWLDGPLKIRGKQVP